MNENELRPCPFCGEPADDRYQRLTKCRNDKCLMNEWDDTLFYLDKEWNTRPIEDALNKRIAELEALVEGHDPLEDFPPKERGFDCSVMVLGKFEYEDEFTPFTNWDLCVYWFDEERWHPLNGYVKGDDIVRWYALPYKEREE